MVMRGVITAIGLASLGACALWQNGAAPEAVADCPSVTRASAWVDQMPKIGSSPHKLIVALKLDDARPWLLTPTMSADPALLVLVLSPGGPAFPGNAGYRETASDVPRQAVSIMCGGRERMRIDNITKVM